MGPCMKPLISSECINSSSKMKWTAERPGCWENKNLHMFKLKHEQLYERRKEIWGIILQTR